MLISRKSNTMIVIPIALLVGLHSMGCNAQEAARASATTATPKTEAGWYQRVEKALKEDKADEAVLEMDDAIKSLPTNAQLVSIRGSLKFRSGKVAESIQDFDKVIELNPASKPYLWQRGIALYYADRFQDGLDQFAVHREVNPNDVENAFWHFLCNSMAWKRLKRMCYWLVKTDAFR
jgi:lipoprotein NlpI